MNKKWTFLEINLKDGGKTRYIFPFETEISDPIFDEFGDISYDFIYKNKKYNRSNFYFSDCEKEIVKKMYRALCFNITWHDFDAYPGNAPAANWQMLVVKSKRYIDKLKKLYVDVYPEVFI